MGHWGVTHPPTRDPVLDSAPLVGAVPSSKRDRDRKLPVYFPSAGTHSGGRTRTKRPIPWSKQSFHAWWLSARARTKGSGGLPCCNYICRPDQAVRGGNSPTVFGGCRCLSSQTGKTNEAVVKGRWQVVGEGGWICDWEPHGSACSIRRWRVAHAEWADCPNSVVELTYQVLYSFTSA